MFRMNTSILLSTYCTNTAYFFKIMTNVLNSSVLHCCRLHVLKDKIICMAKGDVI